MRIKLLPLTAAFSLALLLSSCGIGFRAEWAEAGKAKSAGLNGRWSGTWKSAVNGHSGKLRCIVEQDEEKPAKREFLYHATWGRLFAATFETDKTVTKTANGYRFEGKKNLGILGGEFTTKGTAEGDSFKASYDSAMDRGEFVLERCR